MVDQQTIRAVMLLIESTILELQSKGNNITLIDEGKKIMCDEVINVLLKEIEGNLND